MLSYGTTIPLFPLSVVLFPGMMLPLHIFEKRYRIMIQECINSADQTFGVILAKTVQAQTPGVAKLYADDLYEVGTTARITAVEQFEDGRMNLITVGEERFVVKSIRADEADYVIGQVDPFPINEAGDSIRLNQMTQKLRVLAKDYIDLLASASGEDLSNATLPTDPKALAYLVGTALQNRSADKQQLLLAQQLLSAESLSLLVDKTVNVLNKESQILAYMLKAYQAHQRVQKLPFVDYSLN